MITLWIMTNAVVACWLTPVSSTDVSGLTGLRVRMTELGDVPRLPGRALSRFYALNEMRVMGSCMCHGHANRCLPETYNNLLPNSIQVFRCLEVWRFWVAARQNLCFIQLAVSSCFQSFLLHFLDLSPVFLYWMLSCKTDIEILILLSVKQETKITKFVIYILSKLMEKAYQKSVWITEGFPLYHKVWYTVLRWNWVRGCLEHKWDKQLIKPLWLTEGLSLPQE